MPTPKARERYSLVVTRSWLVLSMCVLSWTLTAALTLTRAGELSSAERGCILAAGACIAVALILCRWPQTLWLTVAAMLLLGATALVPSGSLVWTYPQTYLGYVGFICTMLLPKRAGLVVALCVPLAVWLIWQGDPANVVPEAFTVANGWILVLRMLGAQLLLWWSWWWLTSFAIRLDVQVDTLRNTQLSVAAREERSRIWRASADRVHATMLNSIAALLEARSVDPALLHELAEDGRHAIGQPPDRAPARPHVSRLAPVNAGIVLMTAALGGALIAGWLYTAFVPFPSVWLWIAAMALALASAVPATVIVIRHRTLRWWVGCLLVLAPAAMPWMLSLSTPTCTSIGAISAAASMAGFAIVCIGLWARYLPIIIGLIIWTPGALIIGRATPAECAIAPTVIVLNVATFLPLVAIISLVGIRRHRRSLQRLEDAEVTSALAEARAATIAVIDREFSDSVTRAADALDAVADRGNLRPQDITELQCLQARMRAAVHVDVGSAHGFVRDAYDLVVRLADEGIPVTAGLLTGSDDPRPLPSEVLDLLAAVARSAGDGPLRLQTIDTGAGDFLSLICPRSSLEGLDIGTQAEWTIGDVQVAIQDAEPATDGRAMAVVTVERSHVQPNVHASRSPASAVSAPAASSPAGS